MVRRAKVGLFFSYNENWIGGTYYVLNLIHALNLLEDKRKPIIVLLSDNIENVNIVKKETNYSYLEYIKFPKRLGILKKVFNKLFSFVGLIPFSSKIVNPDIDILYPNYSKSILKNNLKRIYWIPDFQEAFLPELFSHDQILKRKRRQKEISEKGDFLVFSSNDSQSHFNNLYPNSKPEQFVLNFAVTHPNLKNEDEEQILKKYKLDREYFYIPNQFWLHKNHKTALMALNILKQSGYDFHFVFSGKEYDHRSNNYADELRSFIHQNNLEDNVRFLGFIPRVDQLVILRNSKAVIQPSLFEGWSTVVEDAKAQNKFLFLSDLPVHYEQIKENCVFFERLNHLDLANKLMNTEIQIKKIDYSMNIRKFGEDFKSIIEKNLIEKD